jgi:hypothetical protein
MTLQAGADFENFLPLERAVGQFIQTVDHTEADSNTATKTTTHWDVSGNSTGKRERLVLRALEKRRGGGANHRTCRPAVAPRNHHVVIEAKRDSKAVEPGSKIGRARRNSDSDLLHFGYFGAWQGCAS